MWFGFFWISTGSVTGSFEPSCSLKEKKYLDGLTVSFSGMILHHGVGYCEVVH
jgi:hypothetical protein